MILEYPGPLFDQGALTHLIKEMQQYNSTIFTKHACCVYIHNPLMYSASNFPFKVRTNINTLITEMESNIAKIN